MNEKFRSRKFKEGRDFSPQKMPEASKTLPRKGQKSRDGEKISYDSEKESQKRNASMDERGAFLLFVSNI